MLKKSDNARSGPGLRPILCTRAILDIRIGFLMYELVLLAYLIKKVYFEAFLDFFTNWGYELR